MSTWVLLNTTNSNTYNSYNNNSYNNNNNDNNNNNNISLNSLIDHNKGRSTKDDNYNRKIDDGDDHYVNNDGVIGDTTSESRDSYNKIDRNERYTTTTTPSTTTTYRSSDSVDNKDISKSSYYDDDVNFDGDNGYDSDINQRMRKKSNKSSLLICSIDKINIHDIHHKLQQQQQNHRNNRDDDDNNNKNDNIDVDNEIVNDVGAITDAVQIAMKIVDRYKITSSPNKKKNINFRSLVSHKG